MNLIKMAWRNVWRNYRRSMVTIAAMTLALWVELLYSGLVTGMFVDMEDDVTEMETGDIQLFVEDYLERPSLYSVVAHQDDILKRLKDAGYDATARLMSGGLGASGDLSSGVNIIGVDPARDGTVLRIDTALAEGAWLDDADPSGVVVGRGLARTLALKPGSELVVLSQRTDGGPANQKYIVRGVLMSVGASVDRVGVLMPTGAFRDLTSLEDGAHKIIVKRPDTQELNAAADAVRKLVPEAKVMTWAELNPILAQMLQGVQVMMGFMYFIIYVAVAILILNAMLMAVFERIREFGVLKAIGYSPLQVLTMMLLEGMLQACIATLAGVTLALGPMWYLQTYGLDVGVLGGVSMVGMTMPAIWRGSFTLASGLVPVLMLFVIVFFAVLYPALKAAWIRPVEAMHHQ